MSNPPLLSRRYSGSFYAHHHEDSLASAKGVLAALSRYIKVRTILDVGCGSGSWLIAADQVMPAVTTLIGVDGPWAKPQIDSTVMSFQTVDLIEPFSLGKSFDLVISMEVGEHLPVSSSSVYVESLTSHSDLILFSAAIKGQGGTNHINEQPQTFWVELFNRYGFNVYFFLRGQLWRDASIAYWYRQNLCCFARDNSPIDHTLKNIEEHSSEIFLVDVAHPDALTSQTPGRAEGLGRAIDYRVWKIKSLFKNLFK